MNSFFTITIILLFSINCNAQKVSSLQYPNQVDAKVFVVDYENQPDKKLFFVEYQNQADLKIFFVDFENQAVWRNKSRQHLMY